LPSAEKDWFKTVVAEDVYKRRKESIGAYTAEVNTFLKSMAERGD